MKAERTTLEMERLDRAPQAQQEALLRAQPALRPELEALRRDDAEVLAKYPVSEMKEKVMARLESARAEENRRQKRLLRLRVGLFAGPALAALVAVTFFILPGRKEAPRAPLHGTGLAAGIEDTRVKGLRSHLVVYRRSASGVERLQPGAAVGAGEQVQVAFVRESRDRYGIIASLDGRGAVTWHFPETPDTLGVFSTGPGEVLLGKSYVLDDAPHFERFFFLSSSKPFDALAVKAALENLARLGAEAGGSELAVPAGVDASSFLVRKAPNK